MIRGISSMSGGFWRLSSHQQSNFAALTRNIHQIKNHRPNNLERRFLVWTGKYPSVDQVPGHVSCDEMERCRNRVRIRVANIMIGLTIIGCGISVYFGKQAGKRGESVTQQNLDWHKRYNEESAKNAEKTK